LLAAAAAAVAVAVAVVVEAAAAAVVVLVIKHGCLTYLLLQKTDWNLTPLRCSLQMFHGL
jgi:hypothetical protein